MQRIFWWTLVTLFFTVVMLRPTTVHATNWDITTAVRSASDFDVNPPDYEPHGLVIVNGGTKMYSGNWNGNIYQFTLSTPWDITSAVYDNKYLDPSQISGSGTGLTNIGMNEAGTVLLFQEFYSPTIYQYNLSTPYDITTATYANKTFYISQGSNIYDISFKADGTKIYAMSDYNDKVFQYTLSTPWNLSTMTYDNKYYSMPSYNDGQTLTIHMSADGRNMYIGSNTNERIHWHTLSTPWDVSTATYTNNYISLLSVDSSIRNIYANPDGTKMYFSGTSGDMIYIYDLADTANPTIYSLSPLDDATEVSTTADLVLTFSEAVNVQSGNITIYRALDNSVFEAIDVTSARVTGSGTSQITINPTATLEESTAYYLQIDATAFDDQLAHSFTGISSTSTWNFTTIDLSPPTAQAANLSASSVADDLLTLSWTRGNGDGVVVFAKAASSGTATPVDNTTYTASATFGSGTQIDTSGWYAVYSGIGTSVNITGLSPATNYIFHAVEYDLSGSNPLYTSVTAAANPATQATASVIEPTVQTTSLAFASVSNNSLILNWTRGNGDGVVVFAKAASSGTATPVDNTSYTASATFGSGTQIDTSGWYAVYKGTGTSVTVVGLSSETNYIFQSFEYNQAASVTNYINSSSTGNPNQQATTATPELNVFTYTGDNQSFVVPSGVTEVIAKVWGAGGAGGTYGSNGGGSGGYAEATLSVTPGQVLIVVVGEGGKYGTASGNGGLGGWPGGGYGTRGDSSGGGGGGVTGIFLDSYLHANSLLIAGSGGGGTGYQAGGGGGGTTGNRGGSSGGYGGTQSAGGSGTSGADGSALQGGNGSNSGLRTSGTSDGGGGGGGYYGGEGGYDDARGGGGGSGYGNPLYASAVTLTAGTSGTATDVNPPQTSDSNYVTGVGVGKRTSNNGGNGLVVISFTAPSDVDAPLISTVNSDPSSTTATITWETNEDSSSQVEYGLVSAYGSSTSVADTAPYVSTHTTTLTNLIACARYYYRVKSSDASDNQKVSSQATFHTTGCTTSAIVSGNEEIVPPTGGTLSLTNESSTATLIAPSGFTATTATLQLNKLDTTTLPTPPSESSLINNNFYDLVAVDEDHSLIAAFNTPVTFTISYGADVESSYDESTLDVYKYNGTTWVDQNCTLDATNNTLTCTLPSFSVYGVFGSLPSESPTTLTNAVDSPVNTNSHHSTGESCQDATPVAVADLFQIDRTETSATIYFTPIPHNTHYYIAYSTRAIAEEHGVEVNLATEGVQSYTINHLNPGTTYYFKVRGQNGCMPGEWSNIAKASTASLQKVTESPQSDSDESKPSDIPVIESVEPVPPTTNQVSSPPKQTTFKARLAQTLFQLGQKSQDISDAIGIKIVDLGYRLVSEPTVIYHVTTTLLSPTSAKITWETNHPADGKINYGLDESYGSDLQTSKLSTYHEFTLTNLIPETQYHFEVMSKGKTYTYDANRKLTTP